MIPLILYLLVILLNMFFVFIQKRNKWVVLFSIIVIILLGCYSSAKEGDLSVYFFEYHSGDYELDRWERGYLWLMTLCRSFGLKFNVFRVVIFLSSLTLIFFGIRPYIKNYHMLIIVYELAIFLFLAVAIRYFLAFAFIIFGLRFLRSRYFPIFVLCVALGTLFHKSVLFAVLFLFGALPQKKRRSIKKALKIVYGLEIALMVFMTIDTSLMQPVTDFVFLIVKDVFGEEGIYADRYISVASYSRKRWLLVLMYYATIVLANISLRYVERYTDEKMKERTETLYMVTLLTGIIMPVLILTDVMLRFVFFGTTCTFILVSMALEKMTITKEHIVISKVKVDYNLFVALALLVAVLYPLLIYSGFCYDSFDLLGFLEGNSLF